MIMSFVDLVQTETMFEVLETTELRFSNLTVQGFLDSRFLGFHEAKLFENCPWDSCNEVTIAFKKNVTTGIVLRPSPGDIMLTKVDICT